MKHLLGMLQHAQEEELDTARFRISSNSMPFSDENLSYSMSDKKMKFKKTAIKSEVKSRFYK